MRKHVPSVPAVRAAEQLLLTVGRAGVLSSRAIAARELEELLRAHQPQAGHRYRPGRGGNLIYWPRTGEQFADAAYAMARVQATLA